MGPVGAALAALLLGALACVAEAVVVDVVDGSLVVDGVAWFDGGPVGLQVSEAWVTLVKRGPARRHVGRDALGDYAASWQDWAACASSGCEALLSTRARDYGGSLWVLEQSFPVGVENGGARDGADVLGAYPTLRSGASAPTLNYASWGGNQLSDATIGRWLPSRAAAAARASPYPPEERYETGCAGLYKGRCPRRWPYYNSTWLGGAWHGAPTVFYDARLRAVAVAPLARHVASAMVMTKRFAGEEALLALGPTATLDGLPANYSHETVVVGRAGFNAVLDALGDALLAFGGKARGRRGPDAVLDTLGYWTDRGSYYYGNPERPGWSQGRKRVRNSQLQRLISRSFSTRFG